MRRGGVAKTYTKYEAVGTPYMDEKDSKKWWIELIHPVTGRSKVVRWYTDGAHEGMKPVNFIDTPPDVFKRFGFETEDDWIWTIDKRWVSDDETIKKFGCKNGWNDCALFGPKFGGKDEWWKIGCWYAPKHTELPDISNKEARFKKRTWREWVEAAYQNTVEEGVYNKDDCFWGDVLKDLNNREGN